MTALPVPRQLARAGFETLPAIVTRRGEKATLSPIGKKRGFLER
jgi:hypothetical protein